MPHKSIHSTSTHTSQGVVGGCVDGVELKEPRFTRPRGATPSVVHTPVTNSEMLHQSRTLKVPSAVKRQDTHETGRDRPQGQRMSNTVEVSGVFPPGDSSVTVVGLADAKNSGRKSADTPKVFVLDKHKKPLMPCHPARARMLLTRGRAVVDRRYPFTIRLKDRVGGATQPVQIKIDPGATTTGFALARQETLNPKNIHILHTSELTHRGSIIRDNLTQRRSFRRSRRSRNLRYRQPRFDNRGGDKTGWLPPSLEHRLQTIMSWVARYRRYVPITGIAVEQVRFDTQKLVNPEISGVEYQQGELFEYEVREYVFAKWGHQCQYCDAKDVVLNLDHIHPKSRGGSNRASNLIPSCVPCNEDKDNRLLTEFLAKDPVRLAYIQSQQTKSLAAASAVNSTRNRLVVVLKATGLPVEIGTGGQTKWNRHRFGVPKTHSADAACVGDINTVAGASMPALHIGCMGRGSHKRTRLSADGFPRGYLSSQKSHYGFRTGDNVTAAVPAGKHKGHYRGRVAVRATGNFNLQTAAGTKQGISYKHCTLVQRCDGYQYHL